MNFKVTRKEKLGLMREWKGQIEEQRGIVETKSAEDKLVEKQFKSDLEKTFDGLGAVMIDSLAKVFSAK